MLAYLVAERTKDIGMRIALGVALASYLPARRAARIEPLAALRQE